MPTRSKRSDRTGVRSLARRRVRRTLAATRDKEDAAITAAARSDPDNPPLTEAEFARMRPAIEVVPNIVRRYRGLQKKPKKRLVSLRLDPDVIEHFRRTGPGWQARINARLREPLDHRRRPAAKRRAAR